MALEYVAQDQPFFSHVACEIIKHNVLLKSTLDGNTIGFQETVKSRGTPNKLRDW